MACASASASLGRYLELVLPKGPLMRIQGMQEIYMVDILGDVGSRHLR